jgi:hypothetical protein
LATKVGSTDAERLRIDHIASSLAGGSNVTRVLELARHVAECQVHLERVKVVTAQTIRELNPSGMDRKDFDSLLELLSRLDIYERKARSRRKSAIRAFRDN